MTLKEAITRVLGQRGLTYRQITDAINDDRLYVPHDGMLVPQAQVRAIISERAKCFEVDRTVSPHRVKIRV